MKHLRGIAISLVIAIACMVYIPIASSQIQIRVNTERHPRYYRVHHPRSWAHVRVVAPERRRIVVYHVEHRAPHHQPERRERR